MRSLSVWRVRSGILTAVVIALGAGTAMAGPTTNIGPRPWDGPSSLSGPWQNYNGDPNTLFVANGTPLQAGHHYQTRWCTPYAETRIVAVTVRRIRHNGIAAMNMRIQDSAGQDLHTRGVEAMADDVVYDDAHALPSKGACFYGGVYQRATQSLNQGNLLLVNELRDVELEDLQGPSVGQTTATRWVTGSHVQATWATADNALFRGGIGAQVEGGGSVGLGDPGDGMVTALVPVNDLPDGDDRRLCAFRDAPHWGRASECTTFGIDREPASAPTITLSPDTGGEWTNQNVTVTVGGATNPGSGINRYQRNENGTGWADTPAIWTLAGSAQVAYQARAVDSLGRAGHESTVRTIRIDKDPPLAEIEITGSPAPGVVSVSKGRTGDSLSGLKRFEVRLHSASGPVVATNDDELLNIGARGTPAYGAGTARLVLVAVDNAGNAATARTEPVVLGHPLASASSTMLSGDLGRPTMRPFQTTGLRAMKQRATRRVDGRIVPVVRRFYSGRIVLSGVLRAPDGAVMANEGIELRDSTGRHIQGRRTDANGTFRFAVTAGIGHRWTVNLVDQPQARQVVAWMEVRPRVNVTMRMTSKNGANRLTARGRLVPDVGSYGKSVQLQWADEKGRWRPAINGRVGKNGQIALTYQFRKPGGYAIRFRVLAPADNGWPYMAGVSRSHRLVVR